MLIIKYKDKANGKWKILTFFWVPVHIKWTLKGKGCGKRSTIGREAMSSPKNLLFLSCYSCVPGFSFSFFGLFFITIFRVVVPAQSFPSLLFIILFLHLSLFFFCIFPYLLLVPSSFFPPWLLSLPRFFLSRTKCFHFISCHLLPLLRFLPSWYVREKIHLSVFNKCFISVH